MVIEDVLREYVAFQIPLSNDELSNDLGLEPNVIYTVEEIGLDEIIDKMPSRYGGGIPTPSRDAEADWNVLGVICNPRRYFAIKEPPRFIMQYVHDARYHVRHDVILFFRSKMPYVPSRFLREATMSINMRQMFDIACEVTPTMVSALGDWV